MVAASAIQHARSRLVFMSQLDPHEVTVMFLSLGTLLATARLLGELAQKLGQPTVVGEMLAGILWGPTCLGTLAPGLTETLFPSTGSNAVVLHGLTTLSIAAKTPAMNWRASDSGAALLKCVAVRASVRPDHA